MNRILIVDDTQVNRILIRTLLEKSMADLEFYQAANGLLALEILQSAEVDLIILDLMMPEMDGFQLLQIIKAEPVWQDIPVIINSALSDMEYIEHALAAGALDYFAKPLSPDQMKVVLPLKVKNALTYYEQKKELAYWKRKVSAELKIAGVLQHSLLFELKETGGARFYGCYLPCREIGGDFYDVIQIDDAVWFIIADVTGNGVAAALVSAMLKAIFAQICQRAAAPGEVLEQLNRFFLETTNLENPPLLSAFVGKLQGRTLTYANAGHPYPVYWSSANGGGLIKENGFLIGAVPAPHYQNRETPLAPGDRIITYTDGLFANPAFGDWDQFLLYTQKRQETLCENPREFINKAIRDWEQDSLLVDDFALMVVAVD